MTDDLFVLALDHQGSIERLHGVASPVDPDQRQRIRSSKRLVLDALLEAVGRLPERATAGILLDERYGAGLVDLARTAGVPVAIRTEQSGRDVFDFASPDWQLHLDALRPDWAKALTRYHPHGDAEARAVQQARLRALGEFLTTTPDTRYLLEVVIPPGDEDLGAVDGDNDRFVEELRADLLVESVHQLQCAGVEPDLWKVEGLPETADCSRVSEACRRDGRDDVGLVVLGAGAPAEVVDTWLRAAAAVDGYRGFAVGRTIWADALRRHLDGDLTADELREEVAASYLRFVDTYRSAATSSH